jgi:aryl-alcohol dehydrogenase-like predicted oxidoreductase
MKYRRLGGSGLEVSTLCLGAMTFGEADEKSFMHGVGADEGTAFAIMDRARDAGVNFIDSANVYGQDGLSERVVGKLAEERKARDTTVLATKFRFVMRPGPNGRGGPAHPHPAGLRGQPAAPRHRPHRPLPDPHAGPRRARGGDPPRPR